MQHIIRAIHCKALVLNLKPLVLREVHTELVFISTPVGVSFLILSVNGSQLAKLKRVFLSYATARVEAAEKQLVLEIPIMLKNYNFCEYVKFGAIS